MSPVALVPTDASWARRTLSPIPEEFVEVRSQALSDLALVQAHLGSE